MSTSSLDPARLVRPLGPVADPGVLESVVDVLAAPPVDALAEQCLGIKASPADGILGPPPASARRL